MPIADDSPAPQTAFYQHIVVSGLPYARGLSHGQQVTEKIHQNISYYKIPGKLPPWLVDDLKVLWSYTDKILPGR